VTAKNLGSIFLESGKRLPGKRAFLYKVKGHYAPITWNDFLKKASAAAWELERQGVRAGDRVAILSENRPEWAAVDCAAQCLGAATVPIYTSLTSPEIEYILRDSGAKVVAVSTPILFDKVVAIHRSVPSLEAILAFDSSVSVSKNRVKLPFSVFSDIERAAPPDYPLEARAAAVDGESIASVIYTSGTTGAPKGVLLTHANFLANVEFSAKTLHMSESDVHLSFLPLCHVFERMAGYYLMVKIGATIAYAESMDTVAANLLEVRPTFVLGVPRFFEKIQSRVLEAVKSAGPARKGLFFWAKELGEKRRAGKRVGALESAAANALVYKKFKKRLGGRVRFCVSGGAPLAREIAEFFHDLGVMIYEGYGLTETSPVISVNREEAWRFGSVGVPLEGLRVKIAEDGEIATAGACVMKGYLNRPEDTAAVLKDGWFHTGDLGKIDKDGFLWITGRKKELIVTSGGKKVPTRTIEELIEADDAVLRCVLFGDGRRFITALLVPSRERVLAFAKAEKIAYTDYGELLKNPAVRRFFERRVEERQANLASYEKIKYFAFLENDFTQEGGELTPTLKVKRDVVLSRHKDVLLPFYEKDKDAS